MTECENENYTITAGAVFMLILSFLIANGKRYASDTQTQTHVQFDVVNAETRLETILDINKRDSESERDCACEWRMK